MINRKSLFVAGTDTGVGKTAVAGALLSILKERGLAVAGFKPVECGVEPDGLSDSEILARCAGMESAAEACAYQLSHPLAPAVAADLEDVSIEVEEILSRYRRLSSGHDVVIVEGAGGIFVPIRWEYSYVDLIREMSIPVLIVARAGLGTINHTLLTYRALVDRGIEVISILLNGYPCEPGMAERTNADAISRLTGCETVTVLPSTAQKDPLEVVRALMPHFGDVLPEGW